MAAPPGSVRPDVDARLLARTAAAQATGRLPSVVAGVARDGRLRWSGGRGSIDGRPGGSRPDAGTHYRIGSITKTFVAVLVMRLRDEGLLSLDDDLTDHLLPRHLPGTALAGRTVGQLLAHTGGLTSESPGDWWERVPGGDWDALAATLGPGEVKLATGTRFHYSNVGYGVLGRLVEVLRGRPWDVCLRQEILVPLGMTRTSVSPEPPAAIGLAVHPYADLVLPEPAHDGGAMAPAGQLWSTVTDLARYADVFLGTAPEVLAPETAAEMAVPGALDERPTGWSAYGLGLQVHRTADGHRLLGHGGSMPGFLAGFLIDPAQQSAAVVFANSTSGWDPTLTPDLLAVLREHEPRITPEWQPAAAVDADVLELTGPWYWGPSPMLLRLRGDGLLELGGMTGAGRGSRFRRDGDHWLGLDGYYAGEDLRVVRGPDGVVSHLDLATFVLTRAPYEPADVQPGGIESPGWRSQP